MRIRFWLRKTEIDRFRRLKREIIKSGAVYTSDSEMFRIIMYGLTEDVGLIQELVNNFREKCLNNEDTGRDI